MQVKAKWMWVKCFGPLSVGALLCLGGFGEASAQTITGQEVQLPRSQPLFSDDSMAAREAKKAQIKKSTETDQAASDRLDFNAPQVEFDQENNSVKGSGGVVISGTGVQAQSDEGSLNLTSKNATLKGNVVISDSQGRVTADSADLNLDSELGSFSKAKFSIEDGGFIVGSDQVERLSETEYQLSDSTFTTCDCDDGYVPWQIRTSRCHVTQEEYAHAYNASMELFGVPVFYTPYFGFPVKSERASGLLAPTAGYSSEYGLILKVPTFIVIDDSTDITLSPFIETNTRAGLGLEFRKTFSRRSGLKSRVVYSNETWRGDDLQGTNPSGLYDFTEDPTPWDKNRTGGFLSQSWRSEPGAGLDGSFVSDVHLVSDDLFLRETEDPEIGSRQARYTTSVMAGRVGIGEFGSFSMRGEFNQSFEVDDDIVLQRLPEMKAETSRTLRPFGMNQFGFKITPKLAITSTDFVRQQDYDGWRTDIAPSIVMPFRYKNYFQSALSVGVNQTLYNLRDTEVTGGEDLSKNQDRTVPMVSYTIGTGVERVYDLDKGNWLSEIAGLGKDNRDSSLVRLKHTIEPYVSYLYVPEKPQDDLPFFDSFDRIQERSSITYGFTTTLLGRVLPPDVTSQEIPEVAPRVEDLPAFGMDAPLDDLGLTPMSDVFGQVTSRNGQIRRLAYLQVRQNYDYFDDQQDAVEGQDEVRAFSDIGVDLGLLPSSYFGLLFGTNYNPDDNELSSWNLAASLRTDRGDVARTRVNYVNDAVSQVEGNLEIVLTDRMKAAYYTRYDERESEFIENRVGLRIGSACNCWHFDVGFIDTINPDRQTVLASFTFAGLGAIGQDFLVGREDSAR